ncbi:MAG: metal ABC transporter permease, partial [Puniceicoccaceae bacterium]
ELQPHVEVEVRAADHVDLDPGCVLYGAIELTPLDVGWEVTLGGATIGVPRAVLVLGGVLLFNLAVVALFYKELKLTSFDPELATAMGINAGFMHYLLMALVAVTTVAAFEAVGSIIVIAMLVTPAAAAHLLTDRLGPLLLLGAGIGAASAGVGHLLALVVPPWLGFAGTTTSGMMAVATGLFFLLAWMFAPRHGWITGKLRRIRPGRTRDSA